MADSESSKSKTSNGSCVLCLFIYFVLYILTHKVVEMDPLAANVIPIILPVVILFFEKLPIKQLVITVLICSLFTFGFSYLFGGSEIIDPPSTPSVPIESPIFIDDAQIEDKVKIGEEQIKGCNEKLVHPNDENWLDPGSYEIKYLKTKNGVRAYLKYKPSKNSDHFGFVYEKDVVTVLARQNGQSLVKVSDGVVGWVNSSLLVETY